MVRVKCGCCDEWIDENEHPFVLGYKRPEQYFDVPEYARDRRIRANDDFCVIDDKMFFVRGVLEVPIKDSNMPFEWGPWAMVEERDFRRYLELLQTGSGQETEPPFMGWLSNMPFPYPQIKTLEVSIHLQPKGIRPQFKVISEQHGLGMDQREGIPIEKAHQILSDYRKSLEEKR